MAYTTINIEGGIFPPDLLERIARGEDDVKGQKPSDFGRADASALTAETQRSFDAARTYWDSFNVRLERSQESRTTLTREDWMVKFLELLGFNTIIFQHASLEGEQDKYPISHLVGDYPQATPIHIVSLEQDLDKRDGGRRSPHSLMQEYLNHSEALWGIATNGKRLRLLRNSARLSKPTYLEFDLEGMLGGNQYGEFVVLYRLLHRTRFPQQGLNANDSLLEKYYQQGIDEGNRVREGLRGGVENALKLLGNGLLKHPQSDALREKLTSKALDAGGYYRQLLRLVYRFLFLMVAEERRLLTPEKQADNSFDIYSRYYGIAQLRARAEHYSTEARYYDLWLGMRTTFEVLRDNSLAQKLGMAALNGELFGRDACRDLEDALISNSDLLAAIKELSTFVDEKGIRRRVNYAGLDVEELGSVYESLLEYHPQVVLGPPAFELVVGSERKQTGSYYTPPELVHELIESALVPVLVERLKSVKTKEEKETVLLGLRVCDPASGSGHFLLAASRRMARELALIRGNGQEPSPGEYRHALRDIIRHCIYAVDKNPLAVDLCKVALWIEGLNAGLPLSFLDNHIKCGDSLIGVMDLKVLDEGIPDEAYQPVTGDDKEAAKYYKKRNTGERSGQLSLGAVVGTSGIAHDIAGEFQHLADLEEKTPDDIKAKESLYSQLRRDDNFWKLKQACDLWTAAFFLPLLKEDVLHFDRVPTTDTLRQYRANATVHGQLMGEVSEISQDLSFFHWPIEFPEVFEQGGFDILLGNPPWDKVEMKEVEFFQNRDTEIAHLSGARRKNAITDMEINNPELWSKFINESRRIDGLAKFAKESGRFPLTATGRMNFFALFAENNKHLINAAGRMGLLVPTSIGTDFTFRQYFGDLVSNKSLVAFFDFENREGIFPAVHSSYRFCLLTVSGNKSQQKNIEFAFFLHQTQQLKDQNSRFTMTAEDIEHINPNTKTCPVFRSKRDAELTKGIHHHIPILVTNGKELNPWDIALMADLINMSHDSHNFQIEPGPDLLALYEGKMVQAYDHRAASVKIVAGNLNRAGQPSPTSLYEHRDPHYRPEPEYWILRDFVLGSLQRVRAKEVCSILAYKCVTSPTNERTLIASLVPFAGIAHSMNVFYPKNNYAQSITELLANLNSFICDYIVRQKIGGVNLSLFLVEQLPIIEPTMYDQNCPWFSAQTVYEWLSFRILELVYSSWDLKAFARELGYLGCPLVWDEDRRFLIRSELDACFFHLYGIKRDDVDYIMDTFPIVREKDIREHAEYRTKRVILEIYDEMLQAMQTGKPYQTRLDPPPADPRVAHQV